MTHVVIWGMHNTFLAFITPACWPFWIRRLFIILFPVSIPLLVGVWVAVIVGTIIAMIGLCLWCLAMDAATSLKMLWRRD